MASTNEAVIAAAGSGKTYRLIAEALADLSQQVLIVTYTNENLREINTQLWGSTGGHPSNIDTMTLFEFLLRECVKPYQTFKTEIAHIRSVNFVSENPPFTARAEFAKYYLDSANNIYSDAVSDLACVINADSDGKVIQRLEGIYNKLLIDEMQDLAGWDLEFLQLLLKSSIQIVMVGDPRQAVYLTNRSNKNSQFRGANLINWIDARVNAGDCVKTEHSHSHRCIQAICDFADALFPNMPKTESRNVETTNHDGIFLVHESDIDAYRQAYAPQELRWDRRNKKAGPNAKNFGQVKGLSFPRVLIYPTVPITKLIEEGAALAEGSVSKFYVAITRARQSVAIVSKAKSTNSGLTYWSPP